MKECSHHRLRAQKNHINTALRFTRNMHHLILRNQCLSTKIQLIVFAIVTLWSSKICLLANTWSKLEIIVQDKMMLKRKTHLKCQSRLINPRLHLLTRTMISLPCMVWAIVYRVPIGATHRFVLSRNSSIWLKRIAEEPYAKQILKIVLTISASKELIHIPSNTAIGNTNKNIHQLSNSRIQKMFPLVMLIKVPAPKPFVITMNSQRWPPANLSMG